MSQNFYILIRGALGVGKTTISKKLAEKLSVEYISIDQVMTDNKLDYFPENDYIPIENYIKTNEIVMPKIKSLLEQDKNVIIDGCFYYREQIDNFKENLSGSKFIFTLKAPLEVCIERDKQREKFFGKDAAEAVFNKTAEFDDGIIINNGGLSVEETVNEIIQKI